MKVFDVTFNNVSVVVQVKAKNKKEAKRLAIHSIEFGTAPNTTEPDVIAYSPKLIEVNEADIVDENDFDDEDGDEIYPTKNRSQAY